MTNVLLVADKARDSDLALNLLSSDSAWSDLDTVTSRLGFHCWAYSAAPICKSSSNAPVRVTTYPREHVATCVDRGLYQASPGISFSRRHSEAALFRSVRSTAPPTKKLRALLALNRKFNVTRGIVLPLPDVFGMVGMLAMSFDGSDKQLDSVWRDRGAAVATHARQFNDEILRRHSRCFTRSMLTSVTNRQREIIRLLASGLSTAQIAASLRVSIDTINKHAAAVKLRLGTKTTAQTTALAAQWGLL